MKFIKIDEYYGDDDVLISQKIQEYNNYFDTIVRNKLPKQFIDQYFYYHGFHDWDVISIENNVLTYEKMENDLIVTLFNKSKNITKKIYYDKIRMFKTNFNEAHFKQWSYDEYVIDEFIKLNNSYFSHEVFFPSGSSYYVEFKSIEIK